MGVRLAAFDLDGTLTANGGNMTPAVTAALNAAAARGVALALCTGRPEGIVPREVLDTPAFSYIITAGGARVRDAKTRAILAENLIPPAAAEAAATAGRRFGGFLLASSDSGRTVESGMAWGMIKTRCGFGGEKMSLPAVLRLMPRLKHVRKWCAEERDYIKPELWFRSADACGCALEALSRIAAVTPARVGALNIVVTAREATKGAAIALLSGLTGIPKAETAAFGYSGNDLSMRESVGTLIAMGNAAEDLKALATS